MNPATTRGADHRAVVVGSGLAGLTAALELGDCALITRTALGDGASGWAQGGIAAALGPGDDPARHAADTLAVGGELSATDAATLVAGDAAERIAWLTSLEVAFDRTGTGTGAALALGREAGHSHARIVHAAGDATGAAVMARLRAAVLARSDVTVLTDARAIDLVHDGDRITGLVVMTGDHLEVLHTPAVILATGGLGHAYARTTNPSLATGDGVAMALRAGVAVRDLEFVQFHPTALDTDADPLPLVTEALRGAGGVLLDVDGRRFMTGIHPDAELAPRDVVARASWQARQRGPVHLDATHLGADLARRFPTVTGLARAAGLDPAAPLPVTPAQHYAMGGVLTDLDGRTDLAGLYACGEVASTGLHGANRLASNSLLEAMVLARRVALAVTADHTGDAPTAVAARRSRLTEGRPPRRVDDVAPPGVEDTVAITALRRLMWDRAGPVRDADGLTTALDELQSLAHRLVAGIDGRNLATVAEVVLRSALARTESRGAHHRTDHPERDPDQKRSTVVDRSRRHALGPRLVTAATAHRFQPDRQATA